MKFSVLRLLIVTALAAVWLALAGFITNGIRESGSKMPDNFAVLMGVVASGVALFILSGVTVCAWSFAGEIEKAIRPPQPEAAPPSTTEVED